jgi:lysozyme
MITSYEAPPELLALLRLHEGVRPRPYRDTKGILTVGVGRNLEQTGLSRKEVIALLGVIDLPASIIDLMLVDDVESRAFQVAGIVGDDCWPTLTPARQAALIDMSFMGVTRLARFEKMIIAIRAGQWQRAHDEVLNSQWAIEVKQARASCDADMLLTGEWPAAPAV